MKDNESIIYRTVSEKLNEKMEITISGRFVMI